ncbi:MAG: hypothetical protein IJU70_06605 [Lentisphaeria bacterium]|nr:hypothetical protein [Lentisphaeria bacterium]
MTTNKTLAWAALLTAPMLDAENIVHLTGARGDGVTNDTAVIQKAIDSLPERGTLVIPPGHYRCGGIKLKSRMTLRLAAGAELVGSAKLDDYLSWKHLQGRPYGLNRAMILGHNIEDVTVEGPGIINGSGHHFWNYDGERSGDMHDLLTDGYKVYLRNPERPVPMVFFGCRNVVLKNFIIVDSPSYTVWTLGCDKVLIDTLTVRNHRFGPNTDVLDIDCSADVLIRNCDLDAGDDTIALKSDSDLLGKMKPCERITVENCRLSSSTCAVRVGYEGNAPIRDCVFRNITIVNSRNGLNFDSVVPEHLKFSGTRIENMLFENITMEQVGRPFFLWSGSVLPERRDLYTGYIRNITFRNMKIDTVDASFFGGDNVSDITLENIDITLHDNHCRHNREAVQKPTVWARGFLPDVINCLNTKLKMTNVTTRVVK